ncbi:hypothetical protein HDU98_001497 [Podochytrium sp. JEL0797]|nr:hypothetical protein HDU98_001497 [Podochytrium sp. JEL0797]
MQSEFAHVYVSLQHDIAARSWSLLETQLEDLEAGAFSSSNAPFAPLALSSPGSLGSADIDSGIVALDTRVYALLLCALLLQKKLEAARLLVRRVPKHVPLISFEWNVLANLAHLLFIKNYPAALALLAQIKDLPVLLTRAIPVLPNAVVTLLVEPNQTDNTALLLAAQNPDSQPRALSRLVAPLISELIESISQNVLLLVGNAFTKIKVDSLATMLAWSHERVLNAQLENKLAEAMDVESVHVEADCLVIVKGPKKVERADFGPGLLQVEDMAKYLTHLEREH